MTVMVPGGHDLDAGPIESQRLDGYIKLRILNAGAIGDRRRNMLAWPRYRYTLVRLSAEDRRYPPFDFRNGIASQALGGRQAPEFVALQQGFVGRLGLPDTRNRHNIDRGNQLRHGPGTVR